MDTLLDYLIKKSRYDDIFNILIHLEYTDINNIKKLSRKYAHLIKYITSKYSNFWESFIKNKNPKFNANVDYAKLARARYLKQNYYQYGKHTGITDDLEIYGMVMSFSYYNNNGQLSEDFIVVTPDLKLYKNPSIFDFYIPQITDTLNELKKTYKLDNTRIILRDRRNDDEPLNYFIYVNNRYVRYDLDEKLYDMVKGFTKFVSFLS